MKAIVKIVFALLFFGQFCFAAGNAAKQEGSLDAILRRAEIYVDEDLYKDSEVLAAIQKYVGAVEKNFNFKISNLKFQNFSLIFMTNFSSVEDVALKMII